MTCTGELLNSQNNSLNSKIERILTGIIIVVLCAPTEIRVGVLGKGLGVINYLAIMLMLYLMAVNIKNVNKKYLAFIYIIVMYYIFTLMIQPEEIFTAIKVIMVYILPLLMIGIQVENMVFERIFRKFILILNFLVILITILGLLEYTIGVNISGYISQFMTPRVQELIEIQKQRSIFRLYSFMGHPLFNNQLYLMFYVLNNIYSRYFDKIISQKTLIIVSILGISMTASKTGLILIFVGLILTTYSRFNIKKITYISSILILIFTTGVFENTIQRFMEESLTTGRAESWRLVINSGIYPIKFFSGYGHEFTFILNKYINWASAAFEYPIRMFALEFGSIIAISIYVCIGFIPSFILLKRKHIQLFLAYIIIFIDVNTYNGIAIAGDYMLIFAIYIFMILNMSNLLQNKSKNKGNEKIKNSV